MGEVPEENVLAPDSPSAEPGAGGTAAPADPPAEVTETSDPPEPHRHFIAEWTVTILLLLFGTTTLVQAFVIPTGSMEDTLLIGDHVLVDKLAYAPPGPISKYLLPYTPIKRGDIIVFRYPVDVKQMFVKRVVALPGDRLRLVNKTLILNGKPMTEPYVDHKTNWIDNYRDNFPTDPNTRVDPRAIEMLDRNLVKDEVVIPEDHYFAMGDNRDSSLDSRYWGFVPRSHIVGKPIIIYWSYDAPTDRLVAAGITLEHLKDLTRNFFTKTRWARTFRVVRGQEISTP